MPMGVPELDEMLDGGLVPHRPYLLVGPSGTGKTSLALQFLCEGVRRGERSLYVTIEDPPNEVRWNHRALRPELDAVEVFDAIPDVMRYERVPFKDISAVRQVVPFGAIPDAIRQTPEFSSVEVTGTALEQMLRSEVQRHGYARIVIDSLTALQYFCMKGFDPTVGAQTFLRFLTDLRATTLLTVEAPLEDVETPERMLARGEIRLFRWELDGATVRAIGVEKFRGSSHDVRLHPYRIGGKGIGVQIAQTISRDTRQILEPALTVALRTEAPAPPAAPAPAPPALPVTPEEPLSEQIEDLVTLGVDLGSLRQEVESALAALRARRGDEVAAHLTKISAMTVSLAGLETAPPPARSGDLGAQALQRVAARADRAREGRPPTQLPSAELLGEELRRILQILPSEAAGPPAAPSVGTVAVLPAGAPLPSPVPVVRQEPVAPPPAPPPPPEVPPRAAEAPEPSGPAETPPARPASRRRSARSMYAEPPPLPAVHWPTGGAPAGPGPAGAAPAVPPSAPAPGAVPADEAPSAAPAPRRRRRTSAKAAAPAVDDSGGVAPVAPKPRKRTVRRKKAPHVVAAAATPAPTEPSSASDAAPPPPPAPPALPDPPTPEGT